MSEQGTLLQFNVLAINRLLKKFGSKLSIIEITSTHFKFAIGPAWKPEFRDYNFEMDSEGKVTSFGATNNLTAWVEAIAAGMIRDDAGNMVWGDLNVV